MNTLFCAIFKLFHCFLPLMNRYRFQYRHHRLLNLWNIFVLVSFQFHFQFGECEVVGGLRSGEYTGWLSTRTIFSPKIAAQLLQCVLAHWYGGDWNSDSITSLESHVQFASAKTQDILVKFVGDRLAFWNKFFVHHSFTIKKQYKHCFDFQFLEVEFFHTLWFWTKPNHTLLLC